MSEDIKSKMMLPFKPPITITNATEPGEEEGEVVPVPIHIIVDNAADFPSCGGGGGELKRVELVYSFAGAIEGMCDETAEFAIAVVKSDADDEDFVAVMLPSSSGISTVFTVEPDTSYTMYVSPYSGTLTFDSMLNVEAYDLDNDEDLTANCFPPDEYDNYYSVDTNINAVVIQFSIPSSAGRVTFNFVSQK